jgi:hypothetical protein
MVDLTLSKRQLMAQQQNFEIFLSIGQATNTQPIHQ